jgi:hypothetical protein
MTSPEIREKLLECAALIRRAWCRNAPAKDADGNACSPREPRAVAWCAIGAIQKVVNGGPEDGWELRHAVRNVIFMDISPFNDGCENADQVARVFEEAADTVWRVRR